ncbi:MFS transporter [Pseudonocardia acaciae]|uniref:MFS transporter n=1 Tax=Pseudonocardia acaciae TaxID=551276 RepID=UPI000685A2ED|nr:MFS transporter [Pseudonocardia acaciae]
MTSRPALVLVLLCAAQFVVILDTTIVNVALPSIQADLGFASPSDLQYVISLYALTFGGSLILAGRAADLVGRRRVFVTGLVVFVAASLACGLAAGPATLLAARAAQGVASAMVSAAALTLLTTSFPEGAGRNRALGAWGAVGGAAGASGLLFGGVLTDLAGWPSVFFINLPIGLVAAVSALRLLPGAPAAGRGRSPDLPGAVTVTAGLGLLIFGLTRAEQGGVLSGDTAGALIGSVALLAAFVLVERRVRAPLVRFGLFRVPGVAGANAAALLLNAIIASNLFFTTLYVQHVLGFTPLLTGLAFLPNSALVVAGSAVGSRLAGRLGTSPVLATGFGVLLVASLLLARVPPTAASYPVHVLPGFALTGLGLGLAFVSVTIAATRGVDPRDQGLASGTVNTAQQVGFAVGIAAVVGAAGPDQATGYLIDAALAAVALTLALVTPGRGSAARGSRGGSAAPP